MPWMRILLFRSFNFESADDDDGRQVETVFMFTVVVIIETDS